MIWVLISSLSSPVSIIPFSKYISAILVFLPSLDYVMTAIISAFNRLFLFLNMSLSLNSFSIWGVSPFKFCGYFLHVMEVPTDVASQSDLPVYLS